MSDTIEFDNRLLELSTPLSLSETARSGLGSLSLSLDFLQSLHPKKLDMLMRMILSLDRESKGSKFPRKFQLRAAISVLSGFDVILRAGTGSGKTMAMILPLFIKTRGVAVTISPLKLLQSAQVSEFMKYGIRSIAINEDTPNTPEIWKDIKRGHYIHLIVSPEQCGPYKGHIPRFAKLLEDEAFINRICLLYVDEAHFIAIAGQPQGTTDAFRPAYGKLGDLRVKLARNVPCVALSATMPPEILSLVKTSLRMRDDKLDSIFLSTNRPNLCYCISKMENTFASFKDLYFIISLFKNPPVKKTIVFIDHKVSTASVARRLTKLLPLSLRKQKPIRQLHSSMSAEYVKQVFDEFKDPEGNVKILIATSSASNGIDISDIELVVLYGVPETLVDFEQKAGRGGRDSRTPCLVILIAEPWAFTGYPEDGKSETTTITAKEIRTKREMYNFVYSRLCIRFLLSQYNNDQTEEALYFSTPYCCGNHGDDFDWRHFFREFVLEESSDVIDWETEMDSLILENDEQALDCEEVIPPAEDEAPRKASSRAKYRPMKERKDLLISLQIWRRVYHKLDASLRNWPAEFLLSDKSIIRLARVLPDKIRRPEDITDLTEESKEWELKWSSSLFKLINFFNNTIAKKKSTKRKADSNQFEELTVMQYDASAASNKPKKQKTT